jgi:hypothetical protein
MVPSPLGSMAFSGCIAVGGKHLKAVAAVQGLNHQTFCPGVIRRVEDIGAAGPVYGACPAFHAGDNVSTAKLGAKEEIAGGPDRSDTHPERFQGKNSGDGYVDYGICNGHGIALITAPDGCLHKESGPGYSPQTARAHGFVVTPDRQRPYAVW